MRHSFTFVVVLLFVSYLVRLTPCPGQGVAASPSHLALSNFETGKPIPLDFRDCSDTLSQVEYRGTLSVTVTGKTCQMWTSQSPHKHSITPKKFNFTELGVGDHNYCRNVKIRDGGADGGAWCYTMDPDTPWEYCAVPWCSECPFQELDGFVRQICGRTGHQTQPWIIQCPNSKMVYQYEKCLPSLRCLYTKRCHGDTYHYQRCRNNLLFDSDSDASSNWAPLLSSPGQILLACGGFVCDSAAANEVKDEHDQCNKRADCKGGIDEQRCAVSDTIDCPIKDLVDPNHPKVCDGYCDCGMNCQDEWYCNGYRYYFQCREGRKIPGRQVCMSNCNIGEVTMEVCDKASTCINMRGNVLKLINYTQCTPDVLCRNKVDQTNCSDESRVYLECLVNGYLTTVSRYVCDARALSSEYMRLYTGSCDDGIDRACVRPTPNCLVHKHQLCDGSIDCRSGFDEASPICRQLSSIFCVRRFTKNKRKHAFPISWINDGITDCRDGSDEDVSNFKICHWNSTYGSHRNFHTFTGIGNECEDVFVCPDGTPISVAMDTVCDKTASCKTIGDICTPSYSVGVLRSSLHRLGSSKEYLSSCLPGLFHLQNISTECSSLKFPKLDVYGTKVLRIHLPEDKVDCRYYFGESYYSLSCSDRCYNAMCPNSTPVAGKSCSNQNHKKIYSVRDDGRIVLVRPSNGELFTIEKTFVCENHNCIPFHKVCDLVDDCGDGSDEKHCVNHFNCSPDSDSEISRELIPLSSVGDGVYDCTNLRDELFTCNKQVITGLFLRSSSWVIGSLSVFFNIIIIIKGIAKIYSIKLASGLLDRILIISISFGDLLVGGYLLTIAVVDNRYRDNFCKEQFDWLVSDGCSALGVVSTVGSQVSLFSMTVLSVSRLQKLREGLSGSNPINKRAVAMVTIIVLTVMSFSFLIAVVPLLHQYEDNFVNAVEYRDVKFIKGFYRKVDFNHPISEYYGRTRHAVSKQSWSVIRKLMQYMFTHRNGDLRNRVLHFYGNDPVCLFKYFVAPHDPQRLYSLAILGLNFVCFVIITISYVTVNIISLKSSAQVSEGAASKAVRERNQKLQRKVSVIIATDFACWMPFIAIAFLHTTEVIDATEYYGLLSIVILPINSVINPLLYDPFITEMMEIIISKFRSHIVQRSIFSDQEQTENTLSGVMSTNI